MPDVGNLQGWDCFDAAVHKFTHECAEGQRSADGHLRPAGRKLWAYGYMPAFFRRLEGDIFQGIDLDERFLQAEVEKRFVQSFREGWRAECWR
jgi:hypothetical protein